MALTREQAEALGWRFHEEHALPMAEKHFADAREGGVQRQHGRDEAGLLAAIESYEAVRAQVEPPARSALLSTNYPGPPGMTEEELELDKRIGPDVFVVAVKPRGPTEGHPFVDPPPDLAGFVQLYIPGDTDST